MANKALGPNPCVLARPHPSQLCLHPPSAPLCRHLPIKTVSTTNVLENNNTNRITIANKYWAFTHPSYRAKHFIYTCSQPNREGGTIINSILDPSFWQICASFVLLQCPWHRLDHNYRFTSLPPAQVRELIHSLIHSFSKQVLSTDCVPGIVFGAGIKSDKDRQKGLCSLGAYCPQGWVMEGDSYKFRKMHQ